ncbi:MAG: hypothetical protein ACKO6N_23715 [Myxococcota bacterium]
MSHELPTFSTEPSLRLRDNPIILAQARRHLRRKELVGQATVMGAGSILAILFGLTVHEDGAWNGLRVLVLSIMALTLLFRGTNSAGAALQADRTSGILDFHRATPTSPATDALGYLLGSCAREYFVVAMLLPLLLISTLAGGAPLLPTLGILGLILVYGWLYQLWAMLLALFAGEKKRFINQASLWVLLLHALAWPFYQLGLVALSYLTPIPLLSELVEHEVVPPEPFTMAQTVSLLGLELPPLLFALMVLGVALYFVARGTVRRLQREDMPLFSRTGALTFFALAVLLVVGGAFGMVANASDWDARMDRLGGVMATHVMGSTALAVVLLITLTPHRMELARATRRAQKQGLRQAPWRQDGARVWPLVPIFGFLVVAGLLLAVPELSSAGLERLLEPFVWVVIPAPLILLAFMAGVTEYVRLGTRASARSTLLVIFVSCVLPLMVAGVLSSANQPDAALYVAALSPLLGFLGSAGVLGTALAGEGSVKVGELTPILLSQAVSVGATLWLYRNSNLSVPASAGAPAAPASP